MKRSKLKGIGITLTFKRSPTLQPLMLNTDRLRSLGEKLSGKLFHAEYKSKGKQKLFCFNYFFVCLLPKSKTHQAAANIFIYKWKGRKSNNIGCCWVEECQLWCWESSLPFPSLGAGTTTINIGALTLSQHVIAVSTHAREPTCDACWIEIKIKKIRQGR